MTDLNPQAREMADESMVRNLAAQANALWPQEAPLYRRYTVPAQARIVDAGCGTGEISSRLAKLFPRAHVLGVDIIDAHLELARTRYPALASRLRFEHQSVYALDAPDGTFDLTVCRHVLQAIPHADRVLAELVRVTRRGGWLHVIAEDYGMLHFQRGPLDVDRFWHEVPPRFAAATSTDLFIGRNVVPLMTAMGLEDLRLDYLVVDTQRVPRETFASIFEAWRDGYSAAIGEYSHVSKHEAEAYFNQMIGDIHDPKRYGVWMVPVASARVA